MDNNINVSQQQKKPRKDVSGCNNPMYGRKHSQQSRQKMSQAATLRNQQYKKALDAQHHITMDEFLSNNPTVEQYIKTLVRESIQRYLWNDRRISIPNI